MRRKRIILTSVLVAVIGVAAPLSLAFYLSSVRAEQGEQERLRLLAGYALERAHRSIASASVALRSADALDLVPCSEAHVQQLRRFTMTTRSIDDIGYVANGLLKCTSTGIEEARIAITPADFTLANAMGLDFNLRPIVSGGKRMVGLTYRAYQVLIDPERFSDVIVDSDIQMAVAIGKRGVLDTLHYPDPALVQALLAGKPTADGSIHALLYRDGLTAVMIEPRSKLNDRLRREQLLLLPLGLLMAAFIVGIVVWLSRRRLSLMGELKIAIERREFFVHYQPIIGLDTGVCVGAEALIRWRRPDGSMIRPDLFIPVAEGIESQAQVDYLRERKVEFGQGWLFAKALPAGEFLAFYETRRTPSST
jgi:sensor c-di-GMP phosphodiesterase-like protein